MTGPRRVRMRTYLRTVRRGTDVLRHGTHPRLSGGAHSAHVHRECAPLLRTPSAAASTPSRRVGVCRGNAHMAETGEDWREK